VYTILLWKQQVAICIHVVPCVLCYSQSLFCNFNFVLTGNLCTWVEKLDHVCPADDYNLAALNKQYVLRNFFAQTVLLVNNKLEKLNIC